jgi:hypothetical protein
VWKRAEASHYYEQQGLEACQTFRFANSFYQNFAACLTFKVALTTVLKEASTHLQSLERRLKAIVTHRISTGASRGLYLSSYKKKGKQIPVQAWTGPEGSRNLRLIGI